MLIMHGQWHSTPNPSPYPPPLIEKGRYLRFLSNGVEVLLVLQIIGLWIFFLISLSVLVFDCIAGMGGSRLSFPVTDVSVCGACCWA